MFGYLLLWLVTTATAYRTFRGDQVFRVQLTKAEQLNELQQLGDAYQLDFWKPIQSLKVPVDFHVPAEHVQEVQVALFFFRIPFKILIEDLQTLVENERGPRKPPGGPEKFDYNVYHDFDEIQQWIHNMTITYPKLITESVVGVSYEGRKFKAITVSSKPGNPQIVLSCGAHAREWIAPATCMYTVHMLVSNYGKKSDVTSLLNKVDFIVIPSSNPDGYAYTWTNDRLWLKTRSKREDQNCTGVNANRNWDLSFGGEGASADSCSPVYHGPYAFSEKCTAAQRDFVEHLPNAVMYVDVHSYGQLWTFPYAHTFQRPPSYAVLNSIAQESVAAIKRFRGQTYQAGQTSSIFHRGSGSSMDYFYNNAMSCAFLIELKDTGKYCLLLPERYIHPTAEDFFVGLKVMSQAVVEGKCRKHSPK